jgi:CxxC motif-containing protein (DUF1111 family)
MRRPRWNLCAITLLAILVGAGCVDPRAGLTLVGEDPTDAPIADLPEPWASRFVDGDAVFEKVRRPGDGLGPWYIRQSCASCHADDGKGPGATSKMSVVDDDGVAFPDQSALLPFGQTIRPQRTAGAVTPIDEATAVLDDVLADHPGAHVVRSVRLGPAVFGRGALEAIADDEIERVERAQQAGTDGVTGRIHRACLKSQTNPDQTFHTHQAGDCGLIGRFGLKARVATLDDFAADAFLGDMGLTSPLYRTELPGPDSLVDDDKPGVDVDLDEVNLAADYVRLLAIPRRDAPILDDGTVVDDGPDLFDAARCAACHVPSLRTRADHPIPALADVDAPVFSDLLLHDMGDGLKDDVTDGDATGREWRTAPLMGLRHLRAGYLHDGRAPTLRDAIVAHRSDGSEANTSVDAFDALSADEQARLLAYLQSL